MLHFHLEAPIARYMHSQGNEIGRGSVLSVAVIAVLRVAPRGLSVPLDVLLTESLALLFQRFAGWYCMTGEKWDEWCLTFSRRVVNECARSEDLDLQHVCEGIMDVMLACYPLWQQFLLNGTYFVTFYSIGGLNIF